MQTLVAIRLRANIRHPYVCACVRVLQRMSIDKRDYINVCWQISLWWRRQLEKLWKRKSYFISRRFHPLQFLSMSLSLSLFVWFFGLYFLFPAFSSSSPFFDLQLRNLLSARWQSFKYACSRPTWQHIGQHRQQHRQPLSLSSVCLSVDQPEHKFAVDLSYFCVGSLNYWPITIDEICFLCTRRDIFCFVQGWNDVLY